MKWFGSVLLSVKSLKYSYPIPTAAIYFNFLQILSKTFNIFMVKNTLKKSYNRIANENDREESGANS